MPYCKECGTEHGSEAKFCVACGRRIGDLGNNSYFDDKRPKGSNFNNEENYKTKNIINEIIGIYKYSIIYNYFNFRSRASRKEYWATFLINILIVYLLLYFSDISYLMRFISVLYAFFVLIPGICLTIRRLHDIGKSGFWIIIGIIPIIGLALPIMLLFKSDEGYNAYGSPSII